MDNKKSGGIIVLVCLLVVVIIGLCGYILIDKNIISINLGNKNEETTKKDDKKETVKKEISDEEVITLLKSYSLYSENIDRDSQVINTYMNGIDDLKKLEITINNVNKGKFNKVTCGSLYDESKLNNYGQYVTNNGVCPVGSLVNTVSYNDVNSVYKKMFGVDAPKNGYSNRGPYLDYFFYDYINDKDLFVETTCGGCGGAYGPSIMVVDVVNKDIKDDKLVITTKFLFVPLESGVGYKFNNVTISEEDSTKARKEAVENYYDSIDTYTITFNIVDNNYIFNSLSK